MNVNNKPDRETSVRPPIDKKARTALALACVSALILIIAKFFAASASILGVVIVAGPMSVAAIILGVKSYRQSAQNGAPQADKTVAGLAAAIGSLVVLALFVALAMMIFFILGQSRQII